MYVQRTQSLNIQIDDEQAAGGTNWNNVQSRLRDLFRPNPRVGQQKQNILQTLVGQFAALPSDEDSFANRSQIQASTPVISTPKNGSVHLASHMKLPRISAIPRTPLRSVSSLANVSTRPENVSIKRKSTSSTPKASAKKIKTNKSIETVHKTPKSALHFIEQFNNMESPYNSPLTPNTIKNLNHQQSLYRTYQQSRMTVNQSMFPNRTTSVAPMEDTSVQTSFSPKTNVNRPYEEVQESRRRNVTSSTVVQEQPAVQLENTVNVSKNRVKHATTLVDYDETMPSFNNGLADDNSAHDVSSHPDDLLSEDEQEKKDEEEEEKEEGGSSDEEEEEGEDGQSVSAEEEEKEEDNQSVSSEEEEKEEDNQSVSSEEEEEAEVTSNKAAAAAARRTLVNSGYLTDDSEEEEEQQEEVEDTGNKAAAAARRTLVNSGYLTDDSEEESSSSSSDDDDDEDEAEEEEEEEEKEEESVIKPNASRATKAGLVNSGYLSENTASSPLPLTTNIVRVQDSSDSFSREEKFVHEEVTPRPEDFFGIYAEADDDDDELQQESRMPPSSYKSSLSRPSSLSGSSSRLNLKAKSARKSAVMSDSSDEEEEEDDHHHHHHNSGYQSPVYSSPVEDPAEEEEEEEEHEEEEEEEDHHDHHRPMSPASASSHSDSHSDEEQEEESELEEEEEEEAKPLPRGGSSSRRPKHSKDSLKRRIAKHLDEHSAVIRPSDTTFDCRRSKRNRVRPVNYWAGERPLYQKSITKDGNCVSTLVGVSSVRRIEPTRIGRKRTASAAAKSRKSKGKEAEVSAAQKMENILNLSIHKKKLANATADSSRADPEHVRAFAELDFTESKNSQGVFTVMTKREDKIALGKLKFNPRAKKVPTKTGNYVTHFNVVYGTLLLKVNNDKVGSIIKSGFYVNVDSQTTYSIENLRNDQAVLDFTIIQKP